MQKHKVYTRSVREHKLVLDICIRSVCLWAFADADMHLNTQMCVCVSECVQSSDVKAGIRLAYIAQSSTFAIQWTSHSGCQIADNVSLTILHPGE